MIRKTIGKAYSKHLIEEIILCLAVLVPHLYIALSPQTSLLRWYQTDDAFYYFVTARNVSEGMGFTFDGMNPTNGFHPLWMLICIPVFSLAQYDLFLPLRILILIQAALSIGSGILMLRLCRKYLPEEASLVIAFFWVLSPSLHRLIAVGGVEAGLNAFSLTLLWYSLASVIDNHEEVQSKHKALLKLGFFASIAVLSRLDNAFLVAFVGLWVLLRLWGFPKKFVQEQKEVWRERGVLALHFSFPILLIFGSYLLWNVSGFDSIMPVSGRVKQWWGTLSGTPYGRSPSTISEFYNETFTSQNFDRSPFAYPYVQMQKIVQLVNDSLDSVGLPMAFNRKWLLLILVIPLIIDRRFTYKTTIGLSLPPLLFGVMAQIGYYKGTTHVAERSWYWVIELFFTILIGGLLLAILFRLLKRVPHGKILSKVTAVGLIIAIAVSHGLYVQKLIPSTAPLEHIYLKQSSWLEKNTEENSIIAMTGAGALGYFTRGRTIVNIDGVINSMAYFRSLQSGTAADHLADNQVDYIFGEPTIIEEMAPYNTLFEGKLVPLKRENSLVLWRFTP